MMPITYEQPLNHPSASPSLRNGDCSASAAISCADAPPLLLDEIRNRPPQPGMRDPMRGVGRLRQIAALDLVPPLRAGLDPLQAHARSPSRSRDSSKVRNAGTASRRGSPSCGRTAPRCPPGSTRPPPACRCSPPASAPRDRPAARQATKRTPGSDRRSPICGPPSSGRSDRTHPSALLSNRAPVSAWNVSPAALASRRSRRSTLRLRDDSAPRKSSKLV